MGKRSEGDKSLYKQPRSTMFGRWNKEMEVRSKAEAIKDFQRNESDTGSTEVQIAILSTRIKHLEKHLAQNKKDNSTRRGLLNMVSYRKRLLKYLLRKNLNKFTEVKKELGIRWEPKTLPLFFAKRTGNATCIIAQYKRKSRQTNCCQQSNFIQHPCGEADWSSSDRQPRRKWLKIK